MGSIIKAICKCGFDSGDILAGGGFIDFKTTCMASPICLNCRKLLVKDCVKKQEKCPDCGKEVTFYDDSSLQTQIKEP